MSNAAVSVPQKKMKTDSLQHTFPDTTIDRVLRHTFFSDEFQIRFLKHKKEVSTVEIAKDWHGQDDSVRFDRDNTAIDREFKRLTGAVIDKINAPSILGIKRVDVSVIEKLQMKSKDSCRVDCDICLVGDSPMKEAFAISCSFEFEQKKLNDYCYVELVIDMKCEFKKAIWGVTDFVENALIKNEHKLFCKWIEMAYDAIPCLVVDMEIETPIATDESTQAKKGITGLFKKKTPQTPSASQPSIGTKMMSLKNLLKKKKKEGTQNEIEKKADIFIKHIGHEEAIQKSKENHSEMFSVLAQKQENAYYIIFFSVVGVILGLFLFTLLANVW